ncbi:MAG: zf-HC2 domain-containing protein [Acidobacteriota bacterium]|nr:MAG: zf-HC2 domain-containing protein [Acidobacteriota bacterium]
MRCEEIRYDLPLYADDVLEEDVRRSIEAHLPSCPLCRQELDEYRGLRLELRKLGNPDIPLELNETIVASLSAKRRDTGLFGQIYPRKGIGERISHWLMPLGAGAVGTAAFALLFLSFMFVRPAEGLFDQPRQEVSKIEIESLPYTSNLDGSSPDYLRIEIPETSPEVNPTGALVALTRSIVRGKMSDEEVVVVADVFGNGIANIAEVVDPPTDDEAMRELRKAFETNPDAAPFLPATMPRDSDAVRVVLKIQRVDVSQ